MRFQLFISCVLFWSLASLSAQKLHIYYDAFHDSTYYELEGKIVDQPIMKKGEAVVLHVTNYNDYVYELKVTSSGENYAIPTSGMASMFFGGGNTQDIGLLQGLLDKSGKVLDLKSLAEGTDSDLGFGSSGSENTLSREAIVKLQEFNSLITNVQAIESEIASNKEFLCTIVQQQQHSAFMLEEVKKLRNNAGMSPNTNRRLRLEYLEKLLDVEKGEEYQLEDLLAQSKVKENFMQGLQAYREKVGQLETSSAAAKSLAGELAKFSLPSDQNTLVVTTVASLDQRTKELQENIKAMSEKAPGLLDSSLTRLAAARYEYEELLDHRFEKTITLYPEKDLTTLQITLTPLPQQADKVPTRTASPIKVPSHGGLQINASVGISFARYFDQPLKYLVDKDGILIGEELDPFSPIITSYLHFYGQSKGNVSFAGTFGIGLGFGNQESTTCASLSNFFIGPSLIIGKKQRIVLTGGLTGGKLERLDNGLELGDEFMESTIPLKSVYELGTFLGISFNIAGR